MSQKDYDMKPRWYVVHTYSGYEKRGKWSLNRNNRKNEKIKKKQLTRGMKGAIIAKSLVRQSISTKETKKVLDKYKMIW